ncbi:hypothetical protein ACFL34_01585 [Candidatus Sumerlaeota bacterium]
MNSSATRLLFAAAAICLSWAAPAQPRVIGQVKNVAPSTIWVSPDGEHVLAVTVDPQTQKRRVNLDGKLLPGWYDAIAEGTPFFSADGKRHAFVGTRGTNCMVVVDGAEQPSYPLTTNRWPITGLLFGSDGARTHVAYQATENGKHYVVVNGQRLGGYDSIVSDSGPLPGIWDFHFVGSYFAYRAKKGERMVACRGRVEGDRVSLVESRHYVSIGAGSPVWMGGKTDKRNGDFFAFIAQDGPGKERILQLPGDTPITKKTWKFIARNTLRASPANNGDMVYIAGDDKWQVFVGEKEWPACETMGRLISSPSGQTWACTAKLDGKFVVMVNGLPGKAYAEIQHGDSLFPAGDERVVFAAATLGESRTPAHIVVDGKEGKAYAQAQGDSVLFSADKKALAYIAGDGNRNFVALNGVEGSAFDEVDDLRFSPAESLLAYRARRGVKHFVVVGKKTFGPYGNVKPGSLVFSPDGKAVAWAAFGADGNWFVYVDGATIDAGCDRVVSQLTFSPGVSLPAYVGRFVSEGKASFALSYDGKLGREYGSIWMGDGGKLFVQEDGSIKYFAKSGSLLYRVVAKHD